MTISYNWLSEYLPEQVDPQKLSRILTAVGLEVESLEKFEGVKGGLEGVIIGEVLEVVQHPNADKLKLTRVSIGGTELLKIVCGAPNIAVGQKVLVAPVGTTIYPLGANPVTMKLAKIRGEESQGMICAEDEVGLGSSHDGILVLPGDAVTGNPAAAYFKPYSDYIYEIGLTPNRMDAMSHFGVARDVCAYLTFHNKKETKPNAPQVNAFRADNNQRPIKVTVENTTACQRYAGLTISGVAVKESPKWLKEKLTAIGQRTINNIVDITNFILHESGQPLHAFDADAITGGHVVVKNLEEGSQFTTLDEKERKLSSEDLMICDIAGGMCIAGVFGGLHSGVKESTTNIFLESAWFNPVSIRKTSFRHNLRTDAATRFEKGVDVSTVVQVLKRAALLIKEIAGGTISSEIIDVYPAPMEKKQVAIKYHYLKKLSGKNYHPDSVKRILTSLGFEVLKEGLDELWVAVPFSKPDISLPADIVEEIVRIDGLDNIEITGAISFSPAADESGHKEALKEKIAQYLVGRGCSEIVTNSITNSSYYTAEVLEQTVKMINNLSVELDVMRPSMIETGLEALAYNLNRKNNNLQFFEFGKTYRLAGASRYEEREHLTLYVTGAAQQKSWRSKETPIDLYTARGLAGAILQLCGLNDISFSANESNGKTVELTATYNKQPLVQVSAVPKKQLKLFDIKQAVFTIDINWQLLVHLAREEQITYKEVSRYPMVERDLAIVVSNNITFTSIEEAVKQAKVSKLKSMRLFDIFESEKIGTGKKSLAINFQFLDEEKTLTDVETDEMMEKITGRLERELGAETRK